MSEIKFYFYLPVLIPFSKLFLSESSTVSRGPEPKSDNTTVIIAVLVSLGVIVVVIVVMIMIKKKRKWFEIINSDFRRQKLKRVY